MDGVKVTIRHEALQYLVMLPWSLHLFLANLIDGSGKRPHRKEVLWKKEAFNEKRPCEKRPCHFLENEKNALCKRMCFHKINFMPIRYKSVRLFCECIIYF